MTLPGQDNQEDEVMAEINMTPLVDVMLVLLIIFIVTIPVLSDAIKVQLPQATASPNDVRPAHINVEVDAEGKLYWNGQMLDRAAFKASLAEAGAKIPKPELHLSADRKTVYENVARVMAESQQAGISKIAFVTEPEK